MRIPIEGIPAVGRRVEFSLRDNWATTAASLSLDGQPQRLVGTMAVHVASKRTGLVRVEATVASESQLSCDRCGEDIVLTIEESSTLLYAPEESQGGAFDGGALELESSDLDLGWYRSGAIDLADVLREALALALPFRVMCTDTQQCDRRTDALLLVHQPRPGHPAFEVLEALTGSDDVG